MTNWLKLQSRPIKMRFFHQNENSESPPSLDLERSFYNESILFLDKNHFLFYYLNQKRPFSPTFRIMHDNSASRQKKIPPILAFTPACCFALVLILLQQALKMDE